MNLFELAKKKVNKGKFKDLYWEGTFEDYLQMVKADPNLARTAFQRIYDMIVSAGTEEVYIEKDVVLRYDFFRDPEINGEDAIFGIEKYIHEFVEILKAAAMRYGPEKRIILLHGPVGSAKSTIVRVLKKGFERYTATPKGAMYTYYWTMPEGEGFEKDEIIECPMHDEPLYLLPDETKEIVLGQINKSKKAEYKIKMEGEMCPVCRFNYLHLMKKYDGDWEKLMQHITITRLIAFEQDRKCIGTFAPRDPKDQDSTELTGDINYRKIARYGSDSDPRAFNFTGEFNIANRGIIEFIEVFKLETAFLYDLLGASQEHQIKPKKFALTHIDELIISHSVAGETIIGYLYDDEFRTSKIEDMMDLDPSKIKVMAVDLKDKQVKWTKVENIFRHKFTGRMIKTIQKWGMVETTPNHSIYNTNYETFYPDEENEVLAVQRIPPFETKNQINLEIPGFVSKDGYLINENKHKNDSSRIWIKSKYKTEEEIKAFLDICAWYITEGHISKQKHHTGMKKYLVISQADFNFINKLGSKVSLITNAKPCLSNRTEKKDKTSRLTLCSRPVIEIIEYLCGRYSAGKKMPDFVFNLPHKYREYFLKVLIEGDGTRKKGNRISCSDKYRENCFEYATKSHQLATQVGLLVSSLGIDFAVYTDRREGGDAYYLRYVNISRRHKRFSSFNEERQVEDIWTYDIECVDNHNFVCGLGNIVCHNTNNPEFKKLQSNEFMEALRDRTVKVDIPYNIKLDNEVKIYAKSFNKEKIVGKHIAPHTLRVAAMWAVLTRLEEPKNANLTLLQKMKLYNGKLIDGFTSDNIKELKREHPNEGMKGISPRYIQDKVSNALVNHKYGYVGPFMVLHELEEGLEGHSLISDEKLKLEYKKLFAVVKQEFEDIVKKEVQEAISADEEAVKRLTANYIDNIKAYTQNEKIKNKYTGEHEQPDEKMMRSIEEKIDIPSSRKDEFRREIMNFIGALAVDGKDFRYDTNERLQQAVEAKLFEDKKDSIKLSSLVSNAVDKETQEQIDVVKSRLIRRFGYNDESATDVLHFVASIFARGDILKDK